MKSFLLEFESSLEELDRAMPGDRKGNLEHDVNRSRSMFLKLKGSLKNWAKKLQQAFEESLAEEQKTGFNLTRSHFLTLKISDQDHL